MDNIIWYGHHNINVAVRESLQGKHRNYCLCFVCSRFKPENRAENCSMANLLYALDVHCGLTTPVWECPKYCSKE